MLGQLWRSGGRRDLDNGGPRGGARTNIAIFRPSNRTWYLRSQTPDALADGAPGGIPVPADYDGDADLGVFRPSNDTWYLRNQTLVAVAYGIDGGIPVPSGYGGDGVADLAVFRPSNGMGAPSLVTNRDPIR